MIYAIYMGMKTTNLKRKENQMNDHLNSNCFDDFIMAGVCRNPNCNESVKIAPWNTFYITMGHAGFNSPANNKSGYKTEKAARNAMKRYLKKSK